MIFLQKSGNKYHAKTSVYDGIAYHSKLEAAYAQELDLRKKGKDIKDWERQKKLELRVYGELVCNYYIDFVVHHNDGSREFIEVKGLELDLWRYKFRLLQAIFDKEFREHPEDRLTVIKQSSMRFR